MNFYAWFYLILAIVVLIANMLTKNHFSLQFWALLILSNIWMVKGWFNTGLIAVAWSICANWPVAAPGLNSIYLLLASVVLTVGEPFSVAL